MLNLRRVDLNLLTAFEAIFSERNLTKAANRIGMSQLAMSNALSRLRHLFNDDLFVRQGNTMQPTPRAQQIAQQVDQALGAVRECVGEIEVQHLAADELVARGCAEAANIQARARECVKDH